MFSSHQISVMDAILSEHPEDHKNDFNTGKFLFLLLWLKWSIKKLSDFMFRHSEKERNSHEERYGVSKV